MLVTSDLSVDATVQFSAAAIKLGGRMLFIFTKFVALGCLFSLSAAILLDVGVLLMVKIIGIVGISYSRWSWLVLWGIVWLGSFLLSPG